MSFSERLERHFAFLFKASLGLKYPAMLIDNNYENIFKLGKPFLLQIKGPAILA